MISPENIHTSNITQIEQVILRNIFVYMYTYMHVTTILKNAMNLKGSKEMCMKWFRDRKEKGEM